MPSKRAAALRFQWVSSSACAMALHCFRPRLLRFLPATSVKTVHRPLRGRSCRFVAIAIAVATTGFGPRMRIQFFDCGDFVAKHQETLDENFQFAKIYRATCSSGRRRSERLENAHSHHRRVRRFMKCPSSSGISSRRSRRGGTSIQMHSDGMSSPRLFSATASSRSPWLAAIIRTSTRIGDCPPNLTNSRVSTGARGGSAPAPAWHRSLPAGSFPWHSARTCRVWIPDVRFRWNVHIQIIHSRARPQ